MSTPDVDVSFAGYSCEWAGDFRPCREPVAGYAGGPRQQHPLCAKHLQPEFHPPMDSNRLHLGEPITSPCAHIEARRRVMTMPDRAVLHAESHDGALAHHRTKGFFMVCGCGWRSHYSWSESDVSERHDAHRAVCIGPVSAIKNRSNELGN